MICESVCSRGRGRTSDVELSGSYRERYLGLGGMESNGTLTGTGSIERYTPNLNYYGSDSFTYKVNDLGLILMFRPFRLPLTQLMSESAVWTLAEVCELSGL